MSELIDPNTNAWDVQLVQQTFIPDDGNIILQIPIHEHGEDVIAWHSIKKLMKKGSYVEKTVGAPSPQQNTTLLMAGDYIQLTSTNEASMQSEATSLNKGLLKNGLHLLRTY